MDRSSASTGIRDSRGLPAVARSAKAGLLAAAVLAALAALFAFKAAAKMPDFEVYWRAGVRALAAEPLYREEDAHFRLKYLPAFAVLCIPAGLLPLTASKAVWFTVSVGLIPILIALSLTLPGARRRPAWLLAGLTFVLMAKFYGHELILGQVNLLFAVLIVAAVLAMMADRKVACGLLFALAVVIKPYAVLFLPWLVAQRESRALARGWRAASAPRSSCRCRSTACTAPPRCTWPGGRPSPNRRRRTCSTPTTSRSRRCSPSGWARAGTAALAATVSAMLLVANAAAMFAVRRRVVAPAGLEAAMLLTMIPLLSPQGWDYVFLIATPAVVYLVNYDRDLPAALRGITWAALAVIAFSLYDIVGRAVYARFMALSIISVCFLVVVSALTALRWRRVGVMPDGFHVRALLWRPASAGSACRGAVTEHRRACSHDSASRHRWREPAIGRAASASGFSRKAVAVVESMERFTQPVRLKPEATGLRPVVVSWLRQPTAAPP